MNNTIFPIYKPLGKTPLQMIQNVKKKYPELKDIPISYAGRLDPMAHGILLLMIGDVNKDRTKYLGLPKTYTFEAVLGIETDTYDVLGIVQKPPSYILKSDNKSMISGMNQYKETINSFLHNHIGSIEQKYPPYSSKSIKGKPLFWWAKQGRLNEIEIPTHTIEIYSLLYKKMRQISKKELSERIFKMINLVEGDFRQEEIRQHWVQYFQQTKNTHYTHISFVIDCSSGTYVRMLIHELGIALGTGAIALDIQRTKVGEYTI